MVVVQLLGGLGNQMFQYAFGLHLAIKNDSVIKIDTSFLDNPVIIKNFTKRKYGLGIFNISSEILYTEDFPAYSSKHSIKSIPHRIMHVAKVLFKGFKYCKEKKFEFDEAFLLKKGNLYLDGYWQSFKYFEDIKSVISSEFTFKVDLDISLLSIVEKIKNTNSICLHIRRKDYLLDKLLTVDNLDYINSGIKKMIESLDNPCFYIFSDDITWCEQNIKLKYPIEFVSKYTLQFGGETDLQLMIECKHFIIANSSFSWWAAWLSKNENKIVIAPQKWFENSKINSKDLIPSNWISL